MVVFKSNRICLVWNIEAAMKNRSVQNSKVNLSTYPETNKVPRTFSWVARQWWVIILAAALLVLFEVYDFSLHQNILVHIIETGIFMVLLWIIGLLLYNLSKGIRNQGRIIKILDMKHKLNLEFSGYHDWDVLVNQVAIFPSTIVPTRQSCLFVTNVVSNQFDLVAQWNFAGEEAVDLCMGGPCQECLGNLPNLEMNFYLSNSASGDDGTPHASKYCLAIRDDVRLLAVLQFTLEPGKSLSDEQMDLFRNIGDDLAIALKAGQDRQVLQEMLTSETALAERRSVSHYLHDHLGQSLGYLHIKLDQLLTDPGELSLEKVLGDLELMRNAADESYEIVRGVLETMRPETSQNLTNLLLEFGRKLSLRSNFKLDFKTKGNPVLLPEEAQSAIFYAFEELLSNVEKHARATRVMIRADWGRDDLTLTISDNGVGFDPHQVNTDQHFGLEILNERMAKVNGHVTLVTSENSGTEANIFVPILSHTRLGAGS